MDISEKDREDLQRAKYLLENPGFVSKISNIVGKPIEYGLNLLPDDWQTKIHGITTTSLKKATDAALLTMKDLPNEPASNRWHQVGVATSGAVGGFFGFTALAVELPLSTTIILRSVLDIARAEGESITSVETKLECLNVFALGSSQSKDDDEAENGYIAARTSLAAATKEALAILSKGGEGAVSKESASALVRLIAVIAERFGVQVSEKAAAQAIPVIGAAGGALINTVFMNHYQDMAKGHFTFRRLSRKYGGDVVESVYRSLPSQRPSEDAALADPLTAL